jgi:uncharacterized membrane protein YkgB
VLLVDGYNEGIKITQVGNTSLANFTNVFLGVTIGLAILAGTIITISFTSYTATVAVGTAVYAEKLVRASVSSWEQSGGGWVQVVYGFAILIGGTTSRAASRTVAETEQWYTHVMVSTHDTKAT